MATVSAILMLNKIYTLECFYRVSYKHSHDHNFKILLI